MNLPEGNWNVYINAEQAGTQALASIDGGSAVVEPVSAMVLVKEDAAAAPSTQDGGAQESTGLAAGLAVAAVLACGMSWSLDAEEIAQINTAIHTHLD